uniref:Zinc finger protein n=1 Tax=Sipha flava TaxID=143950 RepID=A0A2S2QZ28_9HEMI
MYNCQVCDAKYLSVSGLNKHLRTKHKDIPKIKNLYYCNDCDASFDFKSDIIKHTKTHLYGQNSNMLCSYCTKSFRSIKGLIVHLKSHNINIEPTILHFNAIEDILIYNYIANLLFSMYSVI